MQDVASSPPPRDALEDTGQMAPIFTPGREAPHAPTQHDPQQAAADAAPDYDAIHASGSFRTLKSRMRRFVFPMSALFFAWYMGYALLAAYAPQFMGIKVMGEVNIGIILGLLQFVSTLLITWLYVRFARDTLDPQVEEIRREAGVVRS